MRARTTVLDGIVYSFLSYIVAQFKLDTSLTKLDAVISQGNKVLRQEHSNRAKLLIFRTLSLLHQPLHHH